MRLRTPLAILATAVLAVGLSSVTTASAAQQAPAPSYTYVCVAKNGTMRLVAKNSVCGFGEKRKPWTTTPATVVNKNVGPAGPAGPQGPAGPKGVDGKDGVNGKNGVDGKDGEAGAAGKNGVNGEDGKPGKDGVDGKDGATGPAGTAPAIQSLEIDLKVLGKYTCSNVSSNPAVLKFGNCTKQ